MELTEKKEFDLLSLGEIMLRLSPPDNERITRGDSFSKQAGGAELNAITGAAMLGLRCGIISKLPANDLGVYIKNRVRLCGVSDDYLVYDDDKDARLGVYYYENGAYPRKPRIVYDRKNTSINKLSVADYDDSLYSSTRCFHTSGITLALSPELRATAIEMIKRFKEQGAIISFDVNFRGNLWTGAEAKECIESILPYVDIFFCSEDTARLTFLKEGDAKSIMKSFTEEYPISIVASTQRIVHSPKRHTFGSIIYSATDKGTYKIISEYNIRAVLCDGVTRVVRQDGSEVSMPNLLPSAFFVIEPSHDKKNVVGYNIIGGGFGHGVGMSQNGAKNMALQGLGAEQILNFFYEGCEICSGQ